MVGAFISGNERKLSSHADIGPEEITYLQRLNSLTTIIPVISKTDTRSPEELELFRRSIEDRLRSAQVDIFKSPVGDADRSVYQVCCTPSTDDEVMDASLLMSSEYIQPLSPSDLPLLVRSIFDPESISCLRHLSARKTVQAWSSAASRSTQTVPPRSPGISPYLKAKMTDHIQQEERLAQLKLAKWASDLQRSLQAERSQFEDIAHEGRRDWLNEKMRSEVDGTASSQTTGRKDGKSSYRLPYRYGSLGDPFSIYDDPFGLSTWHEAIRTHGWLVLQVAGGFGVLGAVAMWAAKTWGGVTGNWGLFANGDA